MATVIQAERTIFQYKRRLFVKTTSNVYVAMLHMSKRKMYNLQYLCWWWWCFHHKENETKGVKREWRKWDTYVTAKQKGQIDLLSQLMFHKLSTATANMSTYTLTQIETAINQPDSDTFGRCSVGETKLRRKRNTEKSQYNPNWKYFIYSYLN